jgi:ribonuclease HIII
MTAKRLVDVDDVGVGTLGSLSTSAVLISHKQCRHVSTTNITSTYRCYDNYIVKNEVELTVENIHVFLSSVLKTNTP